MSLFGSSTPETFPEVRATTLDGEERTLPADLPTPLALVVVFFQDDLDPLADQWARLGHQIEEQYPGVLSVLETPVVGRGMKLFGNLATAGIRGQVEDNVERIRTLPIYVDKKPFRKSLHIKGENSVHPFLVERSTGAILWMGEGTIEMEEIQTLEAAVASAVATLNEPAPPPEASGESDSNLEMDEGASQEEVIQPANAEPDDAPAGAPAEAPSKMPAAPEASGEVELEPAIETTEIEAIPTPPEAAQSAPEASSAEPVASAPPPEATPAPPPEAPPKRGAPDPFPMSDFKLGQSKPRDKR